MGVFHSTFSPFSTSHLVGVGRPSAIPDALGPRNEGQFCAYEVRVRARDMKRAPTAIDFESIDFENIDFESQVNLIRAEHDRETLIKTLFISYSLKLWFP